MQTPTTTLSLEEMGLAEMGGGGGFDAAADFRRLSRHRAERVLFRRRARGLPAKISRKGWVCKTYEGELAMTTVPGVAPVLWNFTVREKAVADQLKTLLGERIVLHYAEHRGIPTNCYGETNHFVTRVQVIDEAGQLVSPGIASGAARP